MKSPKCFEPIAVIVQCPECLDEWRVEIEKIGKVTSCPSCGTEGKTDIFPEGA